MQNRNSKREYGLEHGSGQTVQQSYTTEKDDEEFVYDLVKGHNNKGDYDSNTIEGIVADFTFHSKMSVNIKNYEYVLSLIKKLVQSGDLNVYGMYVTIPGSTWDRGFLTSSNRLMTDYYSTGEVKRQYYR